MVTEKNTSEQPAGGMILPGVSITVAARTREHLIKLFTMDRPFCLAYRIRGAQRKFWLADKPNLDAMVKEGQVEVLKKDQREIVYHYKGIAA